MIQIECIPTQQIFQFFGVSSDLLQLIQNILMIMNAELWKAWTTTMVQVLDFAGCFVKDFLFANFEHKIIIPAWPSRCSNSNRIQHTKFTTTMTDWTSCQNSFIHSWRVYIPSTQILTYWDRISDISKKQIWYPIDNQGHNASEGS